MRKSISIISLYTWYETIRASFGFVHESNLFGWIQKIQGTVIVLCSWYLRNDLDSWRRAFKTWMYNRTLHRVVISVVFTLLWSLDLNWLYNCLKTKNNVYVRENEAVLYSNIGVSISAAAWMLFIREFIKAAERQMAQRLSASVAILATQRGNEVSAAPRSSYQPRQFIFKITTF